jgi:hypothetical protein
MVTATGIAVLRELCAFCSIFRTGVADLRY